MTFFTGLGIFVAALLCCTVLFVISVAIMGADDGGYFGALLTGIIISLLLAIFICDPEQFGYQKISVSENVVEVSR